MVSSILLGCVLAFGGCGTPAREAASGAGGGAAGGGGGGGSSALASACRGAASKTCAELSKCLPYGFSVTYSSETDCETRVALGCEQTYGAEGSTVTAEQVTKCGDAQGGACDIFAPPPPACRFTGTAPAGAGCFDDSQCQTGFCWFKYSCESGSCPFPTCGVCLAPKPPGEACEPGQCAFGSLCSSQRVCVETVPRGAACDTSRPCEDGDYCDDGTCAPLRDVGDPCPLGYECDVNAGATCDPDTKKCIPFPIPGLGASCAQTTSELVPPNCAPGEYCSSPHLVCAAKKPEGAACAIDALRGDVECELPGHCIAGRCTLDAPACP